MTDSAAATRHHRPIALWLLACAVMVFAMVVVGGLTRLTHSGLSIVEWKPVIGALPPLNEAAWQAEFEKYQLTPEYQQVNRGMDLDGFKGIFWLEYYHRLLGRLIGFVVLLPFLYFWWRKRIPPGFTPKLIGVFVLGGLQGALGWFMVASGLVDTPRVSAYRLTAHLGLAVIIYGYLLWLLFGLLRPQPVAAPAGARRFAGWVVGAVFVTILAGGFVAGLRAGFAYNTFPLMNGSWLPVGMWAQEPWWRNLFENVGTVQFNHRLLAYVLTGVIAAYWWRLRTLALPSDVRLASHLLLAALALQLTLGISTLLLRVPLSLAAAHQGMALVVLSAALYLAHRLRRG
jgi:cytochrome c oxidase assembly protein subunit 15